MRSPNWGTALRRGLVIPAHPLALTSARKLDERRQRALPRDYLAAGAGGVAVGVHTTQFAIRNPKVGLYRPVLELAAETVAEWEARSRRGRRQRALTRYYLDAGAGGVAVGVHTTQFAIRNPKVGLYRRSEEHTSELQSRLHLV